MFMRHFNKISKNYKYLVFLDFEGTQYSHEIIAIGAVAVSLKSNGSIKKYYAPFKRYVKPKNPIGSFVTNLTGITENKIKKDGIRFSVMLKEFKEYLGRKYKHSLFVTFGNFDYKMLTQTCMYNLDTPKDIAEQIKQNTFDFLGFISGFIRDDKHNPYSLTNYCKLYGLEFEGVAHDPQYDALNLAYLYDAFLKNKDILVSEYGKFLATTLHSPEPIKQITKLLNDGETVTPETYQEIVKKYIDDQLP